MLRRSERSKDGTKRDLRECVNERNDVIKAQSNRWKGTRRKVVEEEQEEGKEEEEEDATTMTKNKKSKRRKKKKTKKIKKRRKICFSRPRPNGPGYRSRR